LTRHKNKIIIVLKAIMAIIIITTFTLTIWYRVYTQKLTSQPPHFDLFIAETFFESKAGTPFDSLPIYLRRPLRWEVDPSDLEQLDSVTLTLKNTSGEKFYYTSWGAPFTRLREDLVIYKNGIADTLPFGGFGCGTGVYIAPIHSNNSITQNIYNPMLQHPHTNYSLEISSDSFPSYLKNLYGDSVVIRFSQTTYSTPWSKFPSQVIFSPYITVYTAKIIENWEADKLIMHRNSF
jgi:hypothetical protein